VHAVLTGLAMVTMQLLGSHLGFGFSAGLFDYVLNYGRATRPAMLLFVGLIYALLYYGLFRYFIMRFDLKTPGREAEPIVATARPSGGDDVAGRFIEALGGAANVSEIEACTTRLRLVLGDRARVDARALVELGSRGTVNVGANGMQVVVGPTADQVASDIRARLAGRDASRAIVAALGGAANVKAVEPGGGRLLVTVIDAAKVDEAALSASCARGIARPSPASVHLLHGDPAALRSKLASLLG